MDEWFVKRKGFAYGIMWSGTGLAGFVLPLLLEHLLGRYGFRTTLRIWAIALLVMTMPLAYFIRPRLPPTPTTHSKAFEMSFALKRTFLLYQAANICQALGFFLPSIYLPIYARTIGAGSFGSALTVLFINVASVFGCAAMGSLTDHIQVTTCLFISAIGTALGTFLLWGLATNLPVLFVFCLVYGLFAGSYGSAWTGIMHQITSEPAPSGMSRRSTGGGATFDPTMVLGLLSTGRGIGSVVSGPLSQLLTKDLPWHGKAFGGYGTGYGPLIAFTGATAAMSGITFVWRRLGWM
ncbi:major facilitator superfamily protein [Hirsutella rhossiliensis]|uniref:Major facilitator superfamily domain-containing protein n=1 Tax=Hirsutella rhossiliensis TaxID=111463 RepID=A0A9P8SKB7_9HYPO|nr:major facilitator superfamily domain-containing protein [Hirsutella rhossiliensis]KAH0965761.1 major facilitator superfamily domain-containing protein [Hirsutella rhossiliensis]